MLITSTPLYVQDIRLVTQVGGIQELNEAFHEVLGRERGGGGGHAARARRALFRLAALQAAAARGAHIRARLGNTVCVALLRAGLGRELVLRPAGSGQATAQDTQIVHNSRCGVLLGLWRSVVLGGEELIPEPDEEELMLMNAQSWIEELPDTEKDEQPNVIFVLGESFFDVTELPGVSYAEDPVADFHRICSEGVSGKFYTHTLGYGTENIELEIMTGINTRFFSWDDMIYRLGARRSCSPIPACRSSSPTRATTRPTCTPSTTASTTARRCTRPWAFRTCTSPATSPR